MNKEDQKIKIDDVLLTPELLERLKNNDPRFKDLDLRLKIEQELRENVSLRIVLDAISEQAAESLEALATIDPTDTKLIINHQARVFRARFIALTLNQVLAKGRLAEHSLSDEQAINTEGDYE
jgi:hypothetical protein